jgi:hypothetical protein
MPMLNWTCGVEMLTIGCVELVFITMGTVDSKNKKLKVKEGLGEDERERGIVSIVENNE